MAFQLTVCVHCVWVIYCVFSFFFSYFVLILNSFNNLLDNNKETRIMFVPCARSDAQLKELLTKWNVEVLFKLFKEEEITVEELKMIKLHHIDYLLSRYKMGVRIRFEHYLEEWRNKLGHPMRNEYACRTTLRPTGSQTQPIHKSFTTTFTQTSQAQLLNDSAVPDNAEFGVSKSHGNFSDRNASISNAAKRTNLTEEEESMDQLLLTSPLTIKTEETELANQAGINVIDEFEPFDSSESNFMPEMTDGEEVDNIEQPQSASKPVYKLLYTPLDQILEMSGKQGRAIIEQYELNKDFTNMERNKLIDLIVEYHHNTKCHLSLKLSQRMEQEILRMFPTEKLEFYRKSTRGKIYFRYANKKHYRRPS